MALRWRASEIIAEARGTTDTDGLRVLPLFELRQSQEMLLAGFKARRERFPNELVLLDAHSVIDTDNEYFDVPVEVVAQLDPVGMIHLTDSVDQIEERRRTDRERLRPYRSLARLVEYQRRSIKVCEHYRDALKIPLMLVAFSDEVTFATAIESILAIKLRTSG